MTQVISNEALTNLYAANGQNGQGVAVDSKGRQLTIAYPAPTSSVTAATTEVYGSLTGAAILATNVTIKTTSAATMIVFIDNGSDKDIIVTAPSNAVDWLYVKAGASKSIDFRTNSRQMPAGAWQVKALAGPATTGTVYLQVVD